MNGDGKYMRLGRRVVRMHAPVGKRPECWTYEYEGVRDMQWCFGCGYGVCSKVGRCAPRQMPVSPRHTGTITGRLPAPEADVQNAWGYCEPAPDGWTVESPSLGYAVYRCDSYPASVTKAPGYKYLTVSKKSRAMVWCHTAEEACAAALRNTPCS